MSERVANWQIGGRFTRRSDDGPRPVMTAVWIGFRAVVILLILVNFRNAFQLVESESFLSAKSVQPKFGLIVAVVGFGLIAIRKAAQWEHLQIASWSLSLATLGIAAVVRNETKGVLAAAALVSVSFGIGKVVAGRASMDSGPESLVTLIAIGFAILQIAISVLGYLGLLAWPLAVLIAGGGLISLPGLVLRCCQGLRNDSRDVRVLLCIPPLLFVPVWGWVVAPEIQFDALYSKGWLPAQWAYLGQMQTQLDHPVLNLTGSMQVLAVPGHIAGAASTGRFLQAFISVMMVCWLGASRAGTVLTFRSVVGPLAAVVLATTPHWLWQMSTAYDDIGIALVCCAAVREILLRWQRRSTFGASTSEGVVLGLLVGSVAASKMHTVPLAAVLLAIGCIALRSSARAIAWFVLAAGVAVLPAPVERFVTTRNPLFPQFNNVFRSRFAPPVNDRLNMPFDPDGSFGALVRLPWRLVTVTTRYVEATPNGGFGLALLGLVLPILWCLANRRIVPLAVLLVPLYIWWSELRYARYLLPLMVVGLSLPTYLQAREPRQRIERDLKPLERLIALVGLTMLIASALPITMASFWNIPNRYPWKWLTGQETTEQYMSQAVPLSQTISYLNAEADNGDRITGDTWARALLRPDLDYSPSWELEKQSVVLDRVAPSSQADLWAAFEIRWVVVRFDQRSSGAWPGLETRSPVWTRNGYEIYDLYSDPPTFRDCAGILGCSQSEHRASDGVEVIDCAPPLMRLRVERLGAGPWDLVSFQGSSIWSFVRIGPAPTGIVDIYANWSPGSRIELRGLRLLKILTPDIETDSQERRSCGGG